MIPGKQYTPELLLQTAWRRKWLIVIPAVVISAAVVAVTQYLPNRYMSDTLILVVPQQVPESYVRSTVTTRIEDRLQSISQQILSRTRLERIIQDFNLYADLRKTEIMEDIVERMRKNINVNIVKGDAFRVSFTAEDPLTAMRVTESLASFFIDESLRDREVLAEGTNQFLESQLDEARRHLIENERKLEDYRLAHQGELPTQLEANMQGLHNTEMQLQALSESLNRDRDRRVALDRLISDADIFSSMASTAPAADEATAAAQLRAAEESLRALELRLKPEHPDVIRAKRVIAELTARVEAEESGRSLSPAPPTNPIEATRQSRLAEAKAEIANLDRQMIYKADQEKRLRAVLGQYQQRIEAAPSREAELSELMRDYETLQQNYRALLAKKQDSQISANLERRQIGEQFKVLDPAKLPGKPSSPNRVQIYLLGFMAALAVGLACAGTAEYLDRAMRSEDDVKLALNLPVLATIPLVARKPTKPARNVAAAAAVVLVLAVSASAVVWAVL